MNTSIIIELKYEYTTHLITILSPLILEGLQSIYIAARDNSEKTNILKTFQSLLKRIPHWDHNIITKELMRIESQTKKTPWIFQLIQAVFKINMVIFNLEPSENLKNELNIGQFIHFIYIECAREFWMDPFLFFDDYPSYEVKRNYLEIMKKIGNSIHNAIRRLLPMGMILDKFIGQMIVNGKQLDPTDIYSMPLLLDIPIRTNESASIADNYSKINLKHNVLNQVENQKGGQPANEFINVENNGSLQPMIVIPQKGGQLIMQPLITAPPIDITSKNVNDQILNIINKNNILTESNDNNFTIHNHSALLNPTNNDFPKNDFPKNDFHESVKNDFARNESVNTNTIRNDFTGQSKNVNLSDKHSTSALKRIINESMKQSLNNTVQRSQSAHSEMKTKILKELDTETVYKPEHNAENYQDVFSNSEIKNTINIQDKVEKKTRDKFFNNYLNI